MPRGAGCAPLHVAVQNGHRDIVDALVRAGARLDTVDKGAHARRATC